MLEEYGPVPRCEITAWRLDVNEIRIRACGEHTLVISHSLFTQLNENIEIKKPLFERF